MVKLIIYNDTYWRLVSTPDERKPFEGTRHKVPRQKTDEEIEEQTRISLSRTKSRIKEICLCNDFQYFMTCTVNSLYADRFSLEDCQDKMKKICHKIKRKNKYFKFIFITEEHKKGGFHFHGMVKNIDLYINDNGYYSNIDFDTLGFNSFSKIQNYNKCCNYITKYITKKCLKNDKNQIYFCSRGLKSSSEELMASIDLREIFSNVHTNEFCDCVDFDVTTLSRDQLKLLYHYFTYSDELLQKDYNKNTNFLNILTKIKNIVIK